MERNKLGQFATPAQLADDVLGYELLFLPKNEKIRFLDPAIGIGSFFSALLKAVPLSQIENAIGYEIDKEFVQAANDLWLETGLTVFTADFLEMHPPTIKPNLIICNPPYIRHHHLDIKRKLILKNKVAQQVGININGLAGLYCYFLLLAYSWMAENGIAGWLIPSEFMDVNYGREIKEFLLNKVTLIRVHRFNPLDLQFDDALVTNSVIWFKKAIPNESQVIEFTYGGTITKPKLFKSILASTLTAQEKWGNIFTLSGKQDSFHKISDYFEIKRGVATGANNFFILSPEKIAEYNIPSNLLIPILPSPRYLSQNEVLADENRNPVIDRPRFLLSCNQPIDKVKILYPSVWNYLQTGIKLGIDQQYLCKNRQLWYAQEIRKPTKFLCSYMGRQVASSKKPFRFFLNESKAIVPNVFLMMYPVKLLAKALEEQPELSRKIWLALNNIPVSELVAAGRVYGDGLHKLEPKELANVPADLLYDVINLKPIVQSSFFPLIK